MNPQPLSDATRSLGKPDDWNEERDGPCETLDIFDNIDELGRNQMISAWKPTDDELKRLNDGHFAYLHIYGTRHPVVALHVPGE